MLKNILKLDGAQQLSKNEQKEINGGAVGTCDCPVILAAVQYAVAHNQTYYVSPRCQYCMM